MTANLQIIVAQRENVLTIPNAALRFRLPGGGKSAGMAASQSERIVYVAREDGSGQPEPVRIKTGISDGSFTEVSEGLKEGDRVVTGVNSRTSSSATEAEPGLLSRRRSTHEREELSDASGTSDAASARWEGKLTKGTVAPPSGFNGVWPWFRGLNQNSISTETVPLARSWPEGIR